MATHRAQYSVLRTCQVRAGFELSSERRGVLQAGQQVEALEQREIDGGGVRVRIDRGWVSVKTKGGVAVLELAEAPSDPAGIPDELKDESAKGEPYVAKAVRFVRASTAVDVSADPSADAEPAGSLQAGDGAEVQDARTAGGLRWLLLRSAAGTTGWASESQPDGSARFEELLPMPMQSWTVDWAAIPEAPFASLDDEPRDPVFYVVPRPIPEDAAEEGGTHEREFDMDDSDLVDDGVWLFAEAKSVAEVTFPPKTLFLLDMLRSPGHNRDEGTVRARRRALSAWLQAVHRLLPDDEAVREFFAPAEDGERPIAQFFQFGPPIARSEKGSEYVLYTIKCTADGGREWTVRKRFSEFSQLRETLLAQEGLEVDEGDEKEESPSKVAAGDGASSSGDDESIAGDGELRLGERDTKSSLSGINNSLATGTPAKQDTVASTRVLMSAVVREHREMDSPRCGVLRKGSEIVVLEEHKTIDGLLRVRFDGGWVSATASNGEKILEPAGLQVSSGTSAAASVSVAQSETGHTGTGPPNRSEKVHSNEPSAVAGSVAHVTVSVDSASDGLLGRSDAPTRYRIRCNPTNCSPEESAESSEDNKTSWEVSKRFSDVDQLRALLIETESSAGRAAVSKLPFPSKIQLNNLFKRADEIAEDRRRELELWLNAVLTICGGNEDLEEFLDEASAQLGGAAESKPATGVDQESDNHVELHEGANVDVDGGDVDSIEGAVFKCVVRSVVRENFAVDSRRCGVLEPEQVIRALAGKRNAKGVLRIKYKGGWVSETDGSKGGTPLLVKVGATVPSKASAGLPLPRRRLRTYRCVMSTSATDGPLLDTPNCAEITEGELVQVSEAMRDRDGNRRLKCEGRGWVSETDPVTKQALLEPVMRAETTLVDRQVAATGRNHVSSPQPRRYKALLRGVIRTGSALDSEKVGPESSSSVLSKQRVINALEEVTLPNGQVRVRFEDGWVSVTDSAGRKILALMDEETKDP